MITGAIGITIANPTDVVKVRLQNQGSNTNKMPTYSGSIDCYRKIIASEGIKGLWTSWSANVVRNSIINTAELASYDQYKQILTQGGYMEDRMPCHLTCAAGAGFTAVVFGSPFDFCTTRHMNYPGKYKGPADVMLTTLRNEGPTAFYKGFTANVARMSSFNCVLWVTLEQIRSRYLNNS